MKTIEVSEELFQKASQLAAENDESVESLIQRVLQFRLVGGDPGFGLTPAQVEVIRRGQEDYRNGISYSWQEVQDENASLKEAYLKSEAA